MVVLIIILAIMTSVIVPSYGRFLSHSRYQESVESVVNLLDWAHNAAVQSGASVSVKFDPQTQTLAAMGQQPDPNQDVPVVMQDPQDIATTPPLHWAQLGENAAVANLQVQPSTTQTASLQAMGMQQTQQQIRFYPDGTSDLARLVLVSPTGDATEVDLLPATGRAVIQDVGSMGPQR